MCLLLLYGTRLDGELSSVPSGKEIPDPGLCSRNRNVIPGGTGHPVKTLRDRVRKLGRLDLKDEWKITNRYVGIDMLERGKLGVARIQDTALCLTESLLQPGHEPLSSIQGIAGLLDPDSGELPQAAQKPGARSAAHQVSSLALSPSGCRPSFRQDYDSLEFPRNSGSGPPFRSILLSAGPTGLTEPGDWTTITGRLSRRAHEGSDLHQSLVELTGKLRIDQTPGQPDLVG